MIKFDKILDKREYTKKLRVIRNDIIKLLKDYEDKKVWVIFVKNKLIRLWVELRKSL